MNLTHKVNFDNYYSSLEEVIRHENLKCLYSNDYTVNGINILDLISIKSNSHSGTFSKFHKII
ncbi:MAG: hypothetical protein RIR51_916, partial [Bacteroidota bacterium]